jgi:hypothetical protein
MPTRNVTASSIATQIDTAAQALEAQVIAWRRDLHAHPELGNREFRTAGIVAAHLRKRWAWTKCAPAWPTPAWWACSRAPCPARWWRCAPTWTACRSPKKSTCRLRRKARAQWNGEEVGVMHACGHDCHVAILMGVATILAGLRASCAAR